MHGDRGEEHEQHGVSRHLQAEVGQFLDGHRDESKRGAGAHPVQGIALRLREPGPNRPRDLNDRDERSEAEGEAFRFMSSGVISLYDLSASLTIVMRFVVSASTVASRPALRRNAVHLDTTSLRHDAT